jgi:F0F1-type ATP synthase alpha subunit
MLHGLVDDLYHTGLHPAINAGLSVFRLAAVPKR